MPKDPGSRLRPSMCLSRCSCPQSHFSRAYEGRGARPVLTRGHDGAEGSDVGGEVDLDGGVAAGVEHLARNNVLDGRAAARHAERRDVGTRRGHERGGAEAGLAGGPAEAHGGAGTKARTHSHKEENSSEHIPSSDALHTAR